MARPVLDVSFQRLFAFKAHWRLKPLNDFKKYSEGYLAKRLEETKLVYQKHYKLTSDWLKAKIESLTRFNGNSSSQYFL